MASYTKPILSTSKPNEKHHVGSFELFFFGIYMLEMDVIFPEIKGKHRIEDRMALVTVH